MYKTILVFVFLFLNTPLFSQISLGKVTYQASINKEKLISELHMIEDSIGMQNELMNNLMDSRNLNFLLIFKEHESLFYSEEELENIGDYKPNIASVFSGSSNIYYNNINTKEKFQQNQIFDNFLIELEPIEWRLTSEKKTIGKYSCFKAITNFSVEGRNGIMNRTVIAWYTTDIPISFGLQNFDGLPGLTLELSIDDKTIFKAIKIELDPNLAIEIKKPKGKIISSAEFNDMIKNVNRW